jgi:hypothetical protein
MGPGYRTVQVQYYNIIYNVIRQGTYIDPATKFL